MSAVVLEHIARHRTPKPRQYPVKMLGSLLQNPVFDVWSYLPTFCLVLHRDQITHSMSWENTRDGTS